MWDPFNNLKALDRLSANARSLRELLNGPSQRGARRPICIPVISDIWPQKVYLERIIAPYGRMPHIFIPE